MKWKKMCIKLDVVGYMPFFSLYFSRVIHSRIFFLCSSGIRSDAERESINNIKARTIIIEGIVIQLFISFYCIIIYSFQYYLL